MDSHSTLMSEIMDEMDPRVLDFIKQHVNTFTRWDLIRFLCENEKTEDTAENLARYIGRSSQAIRREVDEMTAEGILTRTATGSVPVYMLTNDAEIRQIVATLVKSARERTFRMKLVYHILRAEGGRS